MTKRDTKSKHGSQAEFSNEKPAVLVVDDEPLVLRVCRRILERAGHRVIALQEPEKAEQVVREHEGNIGVLVCDIQMPGLSGGALAAQLHTLQPSLKIIFISGHASAKEVGQHVDEAVVGFLGKPFAADELLSIVDEVLSA